MKFVVSFILFWFYCVPLYICIYGCMFCILLFNFCKLCILIVMYVPFWVFCFIVLFCVLLLCKCVLYYCHRVSTQLQLTNISYQFQIIKYHFIHKIENILQKFLANRPTKKRSSSRM